MIETGMPDIGVMILLTSIVFPFVTIIGMLYLLVPLRFGFRPAAIGPVYRLIEAINPWGLVSVFMLAVLISIVKLQDIANVIPGVSLYALLRGFDRAKVAGFTIRAGWKFIVIVSQ